MNNNEYIDSWKNRSVFMKQLRLNLHEISQKHFYPIHWNPFLDILDKIEIHNFLDVGCGSGIYYELLKRHYPDIKYTGIDYSEDAIDIAKDYWKYDQFYVKDINDMTEEYVKNYDILHFGAVFDVIPNANEMLDFVLSLNPNKVLISRLEYSGTDEDNVSTYTAYDEIQTYKFLHSRKKFNEILNKYGYDIYEKEYFPNRYIILLYK